MNGHSIVNTSALAVRRFILVALCGVAALLVPTVAQAHSVRADLDGDGIRDRIEFGRGARELAIRLSATRQWQRLQSHDLIVRFVVADIDHDGDPDLIANTRRSGLRIWINKGRGTFAAQSRHVSSRHARAALGPWSAGVHGVRAIRFDDSTLNDPNRLVIVWSIPACARSLVACETPLFTGTSLTTLTCRRRTPRGPPSLLVS
ncbi:MAG: FG-GAP repeat domain-containing protein [Vicinamibacterales bacterium]